MRLKIGVQPDLVAKIEFMQSIEANLTQAEERFLEQIKEVLRQGEKDLRKAEWDRLDSIFLKDQSGRVHRVTDADKSFARSLGNFRPVAPAPVIPIDGFADIGKNVRKVKRKKRRKA